jgi:hypothetical protein
MILALPVLASNINHSELVPTDRVFVHEEGKKVAEYTREVSVPEGALVSCQGRCLARLDDIAVVAEDQSRFRLASEGGSRIIAVEEGTVYFGLTRMARPVLFMTPVGSVMTDRVVLNASAGGGMLEGYVHTGRDGSEIGVLEGGSMTLLTAGGETVLRPGQRFVLAQADIGAPRADSAGAAGTPGDGRLLPRGSVAAISVTAAFTAGMIIAFEEFRKSGRRDRESSPSNP